MRSVSHCGQTISLYTLHPTWCQRSYTISTKREITSQKVHIVPFFFLSYRLQMKSQWKGLSLTESCVFILTSFSLALQHNRDSPDSATVFFFPLNIPKSPAIPDPLHGWNDHPGNRCFVGKEGEVEGVNGRLRGKERERKVSHVIAGFHLSSQQSHNSNVLQHLANKDDSPSLSLHSEAPGIKTFPSAAAADLAAHRQHCSASHRPPEQLHARAAAVNC